MSNAYEQTVGCYTRSLKALRNCLDKAVAYAATRKFEADNLMTMRLAPDMWPLVKQVQVACDGAKGTPARLLGKDPPKHEDNEKTVPELKARIDKTLAYLQTFKAEDFRGCEDRKVNLPWAPTQWMHGGEYITQLAMPNFYFHVTAAYCLLRQAGVDVGKMDYLGAVNVQGT